MSAVDGVHGTVCNAQQYEQSLPSLSNLNPSISCLTHGQTIGLAVSDRLVRVSLNSLLTRVQIAAEASFISILSVLILYMLVGVCLNRFLASIHSDNVLGREMSFVIGRLFQTVTGSCCVIPLTYTWSVWTSLLYSFSSKLIRLL
jgi:hypothetical protein